MIGKTMKLGRVAGVPLAVHWSAAAVFGLLVFGLAEAVLPNTVEGYSTMTYWLAGTVGGLLFLASLLAHELSHAVVARRNGVPVRGMTLWLFGGVAELEHEPPTPRAELRIAAAGPAASIGCAALFGAVSVTGVVVGLPGVAMAVVGWLAGANLVLAAFNLIPGAPLDGGRILRALLWWRHGDRHRATLSAAKAGRIAGWGIIGFGVAEFVTGAGAGLWTAFIGWFLLNAARAEGAHAITSKALAGLRVADVMSPHPQTVPSWISVQAFVDEYALAHRYASFPVEDFGGRVVGLVSLAAVKRHPPEKWTALTVSALMSPLSRVPVAAPDDDLTTVLAGSPALAFGARLLVLESGRLVGIVSPSDLAWSMERSALGDRAERRPAAADEARATADATS